MNRVPNFVERDGDGSGEGEGEYPWGYPGTSNGDSSQDLENLGAWLATLTRYHYQERPE